MTDSSPEVDRTDEPVDPSTVTVVGSAHGTITVKPGPPAAQQQEEKSDETP